MTEIYVPRKVQETVFSLKDKDAEQPYAFFHFQTSDISPKVRSSSSSVIRVLKDMNCVEVTSRKRDLVFGDERPFGIASVTNQYNITYDPVTDKEALAKEGFSPPGRCFSCHYNQSGTSGCIRLDQFFDKKRKLLALS